MLIEQSFLVLAPHGIYTKTCKIFFFFSEKILQALRKEEEIVGEAIAEIADFCTRHEWVVQVHRFVRTWKSNILTSWRGQATEKIEVSRVACG